MEKEFLKAKRLVNNILKKVKDASADYTIQVSENTANPGKITYACMIHVSSRLEPLTWVCDSWDELFEGLEKAGKDLNQTLIEAAYYQGEIDRCKRLIKFYEDKMESLDDES